MRLSQGAVLMCGDVRAFITKNPPSFVVIAVENGKLFLPTFGLF